MPRKNPVKIEFLCTNGIIYKGKSVKGAKRLDARIKAYENFMKKPTTKGNEFKRPGSIHK